MKNKEKFCSKTSASMALVLFLLLSVLSVASVATVQGASNAAPYAYVYITNYDSKNVSVIDTQTNAVSATVNVGTNPCGVATTLDGTKVYVTNEGSNTTSVIDTATNKVTATINGFSYPYGVVVTPDGTKVYVANYGNATVSVIDTDTNKVTATINVGGRPQGVAVTPDGTKVYVTHMAVLNSFVSMIDTATNRVTVTGGPEYSPVGVAVSPDGKKVYVTNININTIAVIDTVTNTVIDKMEDVGTYPYGIAVNPDGTKLYVTNWLNNTTSVIDTTTKTVIATMNVGNYPFGVAVTPDGTKVYVANQGSNNVSVIDIATNTVTDSIPVGSNPIAFGQFIAPKPSITVISPNSRENWQAGTSQEIRWKYTGNPGRNVKIELLKGAGLNSIITSFARIGNDGTGSYEWFIPLNQIAGNDYKVRITSITNSAYNNSSNGNFIISSPSPICNTSTIFGYSFNDSNGNKAMDEGEDGLSNWTINLNGFDTCKGIIINKTIKTNSTGYFTFDDVNPGAYAISENPVFGWLPTTNAAYDINVPANSTSIRRDFGNSKSPENI